MREWNEIVEMLYDKNLDFLDSKVEKVIYSKDKSKRYVVLKSDKGFFSYRLEKIYKFDDDKFEMLEFNIKKDFKQLNTKIKDLILKDGVLIIAILRGKNIIFPSGDDEIRLKDTIVVVDSESKIKDINDILE